MKKAEENQEELSGQLKAAKSKMKEAEENRQKTSDELEAAKSKVYNM
jgi:F0F1-type ATP synthase membrane subunit b/b'